MIKIGWIDRYNNIIMYGLLACFELQAAARQICIVLKYNLLDICSNILLCVIGQTATVINIRRMGRHSLLLGFKDGLCGKKN